MVYSRRECGVSPRGKRCGWYGQLKGTLAHTIHNVYDYDGNCHRCLNIPSANISQKGECWFGNIII